MKIAYNFEGKKCRYTMYMDHNRDIKNNKSTSKPDGDIIMFKNGLKNHTKSKYLNECYCVIDMLPNCIVLLYYVGTIVYYNRYGSLR